MADYKSVPFKKDLSVPVKYHYIGKLEPMPYMEERKTMTEEDKNIVHEIAKKYVVPPFFIWLTVVIGLLFYDLFFIKTRFKVIEEKISIVEKQEKFNDK